MSAKNYAYVNKDMLVWARSETPFSTHIDVQSRASGISADKLSLWETGADLPSIAEAKKLATVYRVPLACFFLSNPPEKKIRRYTDRRTTNGTVYHDTSYELWSEIERITANRDKILEYTEVDELKAITFPSITANATVNESANTIRAFLGLNFPFKNKSAYKNNAFNYFRNLIEHHGIIVSQISGVSLSEMKGLSVYYSSYPIVAINNKDFERAKVFTLFHELAHLFRRSSSLCMIDFNERNDEEEKICDRIAAEILLPDSEFRTITNRFWNIYQEWSSVCLQEIGDKFGVSSVTVLRRLYELGNLSYNAYQQIYTKLSGEFEANQEFIEQNRKDKSIPIKFYVRYLNQQGYLFPRAILNAHSRGAITYGEMCKTLNVNSKHVGDIERAVMFT